MHMSWCGMHESRSWLLILSHETDDSERIMAPTKASESWHESVDYGPAYFLFVPASVFSVYQVSFVKDVWTTGFLLKRRPINQARENQRANAKERKRCVCECVTVCVCVKESLCFLVGLSMRVCVSICVCTCTCTCECVCLCERETERKSTCWHTTVNLRMHLECFI